MATPVRNDPSTTPATTMRQESPMDKWLRENPGARYTDPGTGGYTTGSGTGGGGGSGTGSSRSRGSSGGRSSSPPSSIMTDPDTGKAYDMSDPTAPREVDPKTGISVRAPKPATDITRASGGLVGRSGYITTKGLTGAIVEDPKTGKLYDYSDPTAPIEVQPWTGIPVRAYQGGGSPARRDVIQFDPDTGKYYDTTVPGRPIEVDPSSGMPVSAFYQLPKKEQERIAGLRGKKQFDAMIEAGIIPKGSIFIQDDPNTGWRYQTPEQTEFYRTHRALPDGKWIAEENYQALGSKYQKTATTKGFDAMVKSLIDDGYEVSVNGESVSGGKTTTKALPGVAFDPDTGQAYDIRDPRKPTMMFYAPRAPETLSTEQAKLKAEYDKQQSIFKGPIGDVPGKVKDSFLKEVTDFWKTPKIVIKDDAGKFGKPGQYVSLDIKGGEAMVAASPQNAANMARVAKILGAVLAGKVVGDAISAVVIDTKSGAAVSMSTLPKEEKSLIFTFPTYTQGVISFDNPEYTQGVTTLTTPVTRNTGALLTDPVVINQGYMLDNPVRTPLEAEDYVLKATAVANASNAVSQGAKSINWDQLIADSMDLNNQEITSALTTAYQNLRRGSPLDYNNQELTSSLDAMYRVSKADPVDIENQDIQSSFAMDRIYKRRQQVEELISALEDYRLKAALLADARRTHIESLNPSPVQGTMSRQALFILAAHKLITYIKEHPGLSNAQKTQLVNQVQMQLANDLKTGQLQATQTATKTSTRTATDAATSRLTHTATSTRSDTSTQESTQTNTRTAEATRPAVGSITGRLASNRLATKRRLSLKFPYADDTSKTGKRVPVPQGSIAWEQGMLKHGDNLKEVVKYIPPPYKAKITMVGQYPVGYIDRGNTPRATIQTIGGPAKKDVRVRISPIMEAEVRANERKITFRSTARSTAKGRKRKAGKSQHIGAGVVQSKRKRHIRLA